jgi:long-subunit acyl-CoA synthetase (AMP-forming)
MVSVSGSREIVGRSSEIIVLAEGKHVVPEDVERAYLEHRAIREIGVLLHDGRLAAVVVPDPRQVAGAPRDGGGRPRRDRTAVAPPFELAACRRLRGDASGPSAIL